jgi:ankyrin repeat protein
MQQAQESVREKNNKGHLDLMYAALEGQTEEVRTLLAGGADVNAKDAAGRTSLMLAVINMQHETVKVLLEYGADVNAGANDGATVLMLAASCGDPRIVQALLNKGAELQGNFVTTGKTAVSLTAEKGYAAVVELLRGRWPETNRVSQSSITASKENRHGNL